MKVAKRKYQLNSDELGLVLVKPLNLLDVLEERATPDKVHHKVNSVVFLVNVIHMYHKWVINR
jgi:hypothetical protein